MRRLTSVKRVVLIFVALLSMAAAPATQAVLSRSTEAVDTAGAIHRPFDSNAKAVVLLFVGLECPVSNGYVPEMNRLAKLYVPRGVDFYFVYSGTDVTSAAVAKHAKDFAVISSVLVDSDCKLAMATGATMTLETAVVLPDGSLAYRGRLDDQYVTLGKKRYSPTKHDLQDAIDAVLSGQPIKTRVTRAVGCSIVLPEMKKQ